MDWEQRSHAEKWVLFPENMGVNLSIDETSLSKGELYTILTNKSAKGQKGTLVAMIKGTKAQNVISILNKISKNKRLKVKEVTLDMANNMNLIIKKCFPKADIVTDRFHVQKLASEAVQQERVKFRWEALDAENNAIELSRTKGVDYYPEILPNGDTLKQLLARSRYLLFKSSSKWTKTQTERAKILFETFPEIHKSYKLAQKLNYIYENNTIKMVAMTKMAHWYREVEHTGNKAFNTVARSFQFHYDTILNFFNNRSTNASAESFNAKIKEFRAQFRGVRDVSFFIFRLCKLYA